MQTAELVFNIVVSVASIVAIGIAMRPEGWATAAEERANAGLIRERRLAYELDLLRDVGKSFNALVKRAGLRRIRLQDVRHSVANHLLARGVPIATVAARLGHSATVCEKTYRHYIPSSDAPRPP